MVSKEERDKFMQRIELIRKGRKNIAVLKHKIEKDIQQQAENMLKISEDLDKLLKLLDKPEN